MVTQAFMPTATAHGEEPPPDTTTTIAIKDAIDQLKHAIWDRRIILGEIMTKHGDQTLFEYARDFLDVNSSPLLESRRGECVDTTADLIRDRLGDRVADEVAAQLRARALVSTADHHGPIDHPFWVNANIISALPYTQINDPLMKYLVVFSFASISVNNASAYPRGILFHGGNGNASDDGVMMRLPIMPDKEKMGVVYGMRPFTKEDLTKAENELFKKERNGDLEAGRAQKIKDVMEQYFASDHVLNAPDLASQITEINFHMWPKLFKPVRDYKIPDLIYLEIETIVTELLLRHHLSKPESLMYKMLFEPQYQERALKYFNNMAGAFSIENKTGTYFFWTLDEKHHRVQLELKDGKLVSPQGTISVDFTPEAVAQALRDKKIFPAMLLCYVMVALYYGMKCLGGFCQVHDLTVIKESWMKILEEMGEKEEAAAVIPVQTKELGGDGMVLAYLRTRNREYVPASGIDMIIDERDTSFEKYLELSKTVTLQEMMNPMLPEMYTVLFASYERRPDLLQVIPQQIMAETGLYQKLTDQPRVRE